MRGLISCEILDGEHSQKDSCFNFDAIRTPVCEMKNVYMITFRLLNSLTQEQASRLAGISYSSWGNIENNREVPTIEQANKICDLIGQSVSKVFQRVRRKFNRRIPYRTISKLGLYRVVKGLSIEDLSKKTGAQQIVIRKIEHEWKTLHDVPDKHIKDVYKISVYIGCSTSDIFGNMYLVE